MHRPCFRTAGGCFAPAVVILFLALWCAPAPAAEPVRIVAFGDSLTSGYGLAPDQAFPVVLEQALREAGRDVSVANFGRPGAASADALQSMPRLLRLDPDLVILEFGANDAIQGKSVKVMAGNLDKVMQALFGRSIPVLIAGMYAPGNVDDEYAREFERAFLDLAEKYDAPLYPFFLDGVAGNPDLNQPDGIHPNEEGVREIVKRIRPVVESLLE